MCRSSLAGGQTDVDASFSSHQCMGIDQLFAQTASNETQVQGALIYSESHCKAFITGHCRGCRTGYRGVCFRAPVFVAEILSRLSASDSILEDRHSSSICCFQGFPLGSTGSPAALRRQLGWFSAGASGFISRWSPAANLHPNTHKLT